MCTTGEITATNQIKSERDSFLAAARLSLYSSSKLILSPSSELLYGHPTLVAPLVSGQTFARIPKHLPTVLYHFGFSRYPCACFACLCATVLPLSILLVDTTGLMSDNSSSYLDTPL
ncbi:hypothetical protein Acr_00g0100270 [Actinidia rufa]|uniref:Uncharacterized protein n=1 Tax=Actinidia rufa TaxID=165716 RepID=A0A7J0E0F5_9ERIC|nr:hypothetical protein Acr_00g0100270 [Actinidia rufa]